MWNNFEHLVWKKIKHYELDRKKLFLTVSGGVDSLVLVYLFAKLNLTENVIVLHYHHGDFQNKNFRDQALALVQKTCEKMGLPCRTEKSTEDLKSEAECRQARRLFFQRQAENNIIVTGHHLDDVLETRLIKMIRGTGASGLLAFSEYNYKTFRPFLDFSKKQILDYAEANNIQYLDDPTNTETDFLRNWIRNDWLPALDKKHRGGVRQLALSIDRILEGHDDLSKNIEFDGEKVTLSRLWFFGLSAKDQLKILSQSLQYFESIEFTFGNLQEINKRLDKNQKEHIFTELGLNWVFDAQQIVIRFVGNK